MMQKKRKEKSNIQAHIKNNKKHQHYGAFIYVKILFVFIKMLSCIDYIISHLIYIWLVFSWNFIKKLAIKTSSYFVVVRDNTRHQLFIVIIKKLSCINYIISHLVYIWLVFSWNFIKELAIKTSSFNMVAPRRIELRSPA